MKLKCYVKFTRSCPLEVRGLALIKKRFYNIFHCRVYGVKDSFRGLTTRCASNTQIREFIRSTVVSISIHYFLQCMGLVDYEEFLVGIAVCCRGTKCERIHVLFQVILHFNVLAVMSC